MLKCLILSCFILFLSHCKKTTFNQPTATVLFSIDTLKQKEINLNQDRVSLFIIEQNTQATDQAWSYKIIHESTIQLTSLSQESTLIHIPEGGPWRVALVVSTDTGDGITKTPKYIGYKDRLSFEKDKTYTIDFDLYKSTQASINVQLPTSELRELNYLLQTSKDNPNTGCNFTLTKKNNPTETMPLEYSAFLPIQNLITHTQARLDGDMYFNHRTDFKDGFLIPRGDYTMALGACFYQNKLWKTYTLKDQDKIVTLTQNKITEKTLSVINNNTDNPKDSALALRIFSHHQNLQKTANLLANDSHIQVELITTDTPLQVVQKNINIIVSLHKVEVLQNLLESPNNIIGFSDFSKKTTISTALNNGVLDLNLGLLNNIIESQLIRVTATAPDNPHIHPGEWLISIAPDGRCLTHTTTPLDNLRTISFFSNQTFYITKLDESHYLGDTQDIHVALISPWQPGSKSYCIQDTLPTDDIALPNHARQSGKIGLAFEQISKTIQPFSFYLDNDQDVRVYENLTLPSNTDQVLSLFTFDFLNLYGQGQRSFYNIIAPKLSNISHIYLPTHLLSSSFFYHEDTLYNQQMPSLFTTTTLTIDESH